MRTVFATVAGVGLLLSLQAIAQELGDEEKDGPAILLKKKEKKSDEGEPRLKKKEKPKLPVLKKKSEEPAVDAEEVIARLRKNMKASEERLDDKDAGRKTLRIQKDILEDLDALIESDPQDKGQPKSGQRESQPNAKPQPKDSPDKQQKGSKGSKKEEQPQPKQQSGSSKREPPKKLRAKPKTKKGDKSGEGAQGQPGQNPGKKQPSGAGNGTDSLTKKKKRTISDLASDVWGHLPPKKQQEMDAYSRERFMPKYEELLRQYYRSLAEYGADR